MSVPKVEKIADRMIIGEGPHWDHEVQALYYVDIVGSTVNKYVPASNKHTAVKIDGGPVSLVIPVAGSKNKFVITVGRKVAIMNWDGESTNPTSVDYVSAVDDEEGKRENRMNDGKVDPTGRLWAGTMGPDVGSATEFTPELGSLFSFSKDWKPTTHVTNITIANGLAWSEDQKLMYYIDSPTKRVDAFDFDAIKGCISNRRPVFDFKANNIEGLPDGMAIDTEGKLWVACFGSSQVIRVDPVTGKLLTKITFPAVQITSVTFGGAQLDELFVTSSSLYLSEEHLQTYPLSGATFRVTGLGAKGFPGQQVVL